MKVPREVDPGRIEDRSESWPRVAIVGAPNVGKSRLFNRLTGSRSIVHDRPGVTRDRIEALCQWDGRNFWVLDTGGLIPGDPDELTHGVQVQVLKGVEKAELLLFVVDGRVGMTPLDQVLAPLFRRSGRKVLLVVNKVDVDGQEGCLSDFFPLGFREPIAVSAEEGRGISALLDRITASLPVDTHDPSALPQKHAIDLAVVGRPNVGKSTLFNRLAGEERSVVSRIPGTTRDPVRAELTSRGRRYRIVDTAGLRRKVGGDAEDVEAQSVTRAMTVIKKADLVLAVLDATEPATHQDLAVVGACLKSLRPLLVVLNKIDRMAADEDAEQVVERARAKLHFSSDVPVVAVSALTGTGVDRILDLLDRLAEECARQIPTPALNAALEEAVGLRSPSDRYRIRIPRLYYITQTGNFPPSFVIFTNGARIDTSYRRYLAKRLKESLGIHLAPVALRFRERT